MFDLSVQKLVDDAKLPMVAHDGEDFGYDVFSADDDVTIAPGEQKMIRTGFAMEVKPISLATVTTTGGILFKKLKLGLIAKQPSGLASKALIDVKAGVLDAGFRAEIKILLYNYGKETKTFRFGDKIAQLVPAFVLTGQVKQVSELSESARGTAGWGSGHTDGKKA